MSRLPQHDWALVTAGVGWMPTPSSGLTCINGRSFAAYRFRTSPNRGHPDRCHGDPKNRGSSGEETSQAVGLHLSAKLGAEEKGHLMAPKKTCRCRMPANLDREVGTAFSGAYDGSLAVAVTAMPYLLGDLHALGYNAWDTKRHNGCGTGNDTKVAVKPGLRADLLDLNDELVELGWATGPQ